MNLIIAIIDKVTQSVCELLNLHLRCSFVLFLSSCYFMLRACVFSTGSMFGSLGEVFKGSRKSCESKFTIKKILLLQYVQLQFVM